VSRGHLRAGGCSLAGPVLAAGDPLASCVTRFKYRVTLYLRERGEVEKGSS